MSLNLCLQALWFEYPSCWSLTALCKEHGTVLSVSGIFKLKRKKKTKESGKQLSHLTPNRSKYTFLTFWRHCGGEEGGDIKGRAGWTFFVAVILTSTDFSEGQWERGEEERERGRDREMGRDPSLQYVRGEKWEPQFMWEFFTGSKTTAVFLHILCFNFSIYCSTRTKVTRFFLRKKGRHFLWDGMYCSASDTSACSGRPAVHSFTVVAW